MSLRISSKSRSSIGKIPSLEGPGTPRANAKLHQRDKDSTLQDRAEGVHCQWELQRLQSNPGMSL